jgi:hypothetical protein
MFAPFACSASSRNDLQYTQFLKMTHTFLYTSAAQASPLHESLYRREAFTRLDVPVESQRNPDQTIRRLHPLYASGGFPNVLCVLVSHQ